MQNPALQSLRDIHLPSPISIWPLAPGWIVLIILLLIAIIWISLRAYRYYRRQQIKRLAMQRIQQLQMAHQKHTQPPQQIIAELSILLRRVALAYFKRADIAGLYGEKWLTFLDDTGESKSFRHPAGELLITAPYQKQVTAKLEPLLLMCQQWVKSRV